MGNTWRSDQPRHVILAHAWHTYDGVRRHRSGACPRMGWASAFRFVIGVSLCPAKISGGKTVRSSYCYANLSFDTLPFSPQSKRAKPRPGIHEGTEGGNGEVARHRAERLGLPPCYRPVVSHRRVLRDRNSATDFTGERPPLNFHIFVRAACLTPHVLALRFAPCAYRATCTNVIMEQRVSVATFDADSTDVKTSSLRTLLC